MSEDPTRNLFEERVLNELAAMRTDFNNRFDGLDGRLTSLENKVDARLRETRPIWEGVQERLTEIEASLKEFKGIQSPFENFGQRFFQAARTRRGVRRKSAKRLRGALWDAYLK